MPDLSSWLTAIATAFIAGASIVNVCILKSTNKKDEEFKQRVADLYHAIVVATIVAQPEPGTSESYAKRINRFNQYYKGKTLIFPESH